MSDERFVGLSTEQAMNKLRAMSDEELKSLGVMAADARIEPDGKNRVFLFDSGGDPIGFAVEAPDGTLRLPTE
jgi:hypothetical protein